MNSANDLPRAPALPPLSVRRAGRAAAQAARRSLGWLATALAVALAGQPLLGGLPRGHDTLLHYYRVPVLNAMWRQGVLFTRWSPDLLLGYGYPLFTFYPPLSAYLIGLLYWVVGQRASLAVSVAFGLSIALAGVGMYLLGRMLYGRAGGVLAAVAYVLSPHLLYQTYQRGSISNALAMGFFPLATWALLRYLRAPALRRAVPVTLAVAGVLMSHVAASLVFMPALGTLGLAAALWWATPPGRRGAHLGRAVSLVAVPIALGLGLSAFSWLPAWAEVGSIRYGEAVAAPDVHWSLHFADVFAWPPGAVDGLANPAISQSIGVVVFVLGALGTVWAEGRLVAAWRRRTPGSGADVLTVVAGIVGLASVYLASPSSAPLWARSAFVRNLQFPWRCLDPGALGLALAAGRLAAGRARWPLVRAGLLVVAVGGLTLNALPYMTPPRLTGALPQRPTLVDASAYQSAYGTYGLTSWGEYLPTSAGWIPEAPLFPGADAGAGLHEKTALGSLPPGALLAARGDPWHAVLDVAPEQPLLLTLHTYWFAGWRATIDGIRVPLDPDAQGLLTLQVPAGRHRVEVRWGHTPLRAAADGLSVLSAIILLGAMIRRRPSAERTVAGEGFTAAMATASPAVERGRPNHALPLLGMATALLILLAGKALALDRVDSPLLRHVGQGGLRGVARPPWGNVEGQFRLVGHELEPGGRVTLYWQALAPMTEDHIIVVEARDMRGAPVAATRNTHPGLSLTSRWQPGDLVRDVHLLALPDADPPIAYRLAVRVLHPDTEEPLAVVDAPSPEMRDVPLGVIRRSAEAPLPDSGAALNVRFGEAIELERAALPGEASADAPLEYVLVWRGLASMAHDYTVFVHLLDAEGAVVATDDGQPRGGLYPTSVWEPGEVVLDARTWPLEVPSGVYRVEVGLYRLDTGERLPSAGPGPHLGDRVALGELRVTGGAGGP